jgi:hypothetical protein
MIDALNGVICTPDILGANLWGWVEFAGAIGEKIEPIVMIGKVTRLPSDRLAELHSKLVQFWEVGDIPNIDDRMEEVGLDSFCKEPRS